MSDEKKKWYPIETFNLSHVCSVLNRADELEVKSEDIKTVSNESGIVVIVYTTMATYLRIKIG